jgi:hypothetical protein
MPWSKMVDFRITDEDRSEDMMPMMGDQYPPGLCIRLTMRELEKLGLDTDCDVGDMIDMRVFGTVEAVQKRGDDCCVEIQLRNGALEDESEEETPEPPARRRYGKRG